MNLCKDCKHCEITACSSDTYNYRCLLYRKTYKTKVDEIDGDLLWVPGHPTEVNRFWNQPDGASKVRQMWCHGEKWEARPPSLFQRMIQRFKQ